MWAWVGLALALAFVDLSRPPRAQFSTAAFLAGIRLYQETLSPWMPRLGVECRFEPTCSRYARAVVERYGALGGGLRTLGRLVRCGPWTPRGTVDPPPGGANIEGWRPPT